MENKSGATSWMRFDKDFASMLSVVMQLLKLGSINAIVPVMARTEAKMQNPDILGESNHSS